MGDLTDLRLFPLNTVLFPNAALPLHIFEERYKLMMRECIAADSRFGVVLIRSGKEVGGRAEPYRVGTAARIAQVQRLADGRMNIIAIGEARFRIERFLQSAPYLLARVELLADEPDDAGAAADNAAAVCALYERYYRLALTLTEQWQAHVVSPNAPHDLADFVGAHLEVDAQLKQELLETLPVGKRLNSERELLRQAIAMLEDQVAAQRRSKYAGLGSLN